MDMLMHFNRLRIGALMKKQGFTLAELLITLGIIGVAAALMSPAVSSFMPDKNKMLVMKIHNKIASATESMLGNSELYYSGKDENGRASCFGLGCTHKSLDTTYNSFTGESKYPNILARLSHVGKSDIVSNTDGSVTFVPLKGTTCTISSVINDNGMVVSTATVNIGVSDKYCTYDATNCKVPNQYVFKIDTYGNIAPADKMSIAYLKNQNNYSNKNEDKNVANSITAIPDWDTLMAVEGNGSTSWQDALMSGDYVTYTEVPEDTGNEDDGNNGNNGNNDNGNGDTGNGDNGNNGNGDTGNGDNGNNGNNDNGNNNNNNNNNPPLAITRPETGLIPGTGLIGNNTGNNTGNNSGNNSGLGGGSGGQIIEDQLPFDTECDPNYNRNMTHLEQMACQQKNNGPANLQIFQ